MSPSKLRNLKETMNRLGADKWKRAGQILKDYGVRGLLAKVRKRMEEGAPDPATMEDPYILINDCPPPKSGRMSADILDTICLTVAPNADHVAAVAIGTVSDAGGSVHLEICDGQTTVVETAASVAPGENMTFIPFPPFITGTVRPLTFIFTATNAHVAHDPKHTRDGFALQQGGRVYVRLYSHVDPTYARWMAFNDPGAKELEAQRRHSFANGPLFSIVVPLYNTPERYLREMIASVQAQTYGGWELCLADGSTDGLNREQICGSFSDSRIRYRKLESNAGIVGNTNEALKMVTGDYVGLLDHDDLLAPHALYANADLIASDPAYEFIYSDEDKITEGGGRRFFPFFKPTYSPDFLDGCNYITHFLVFKKSLLDAVGWFREGFDGSQDYEIILRLTRQARRVGHIPQVLYHWRTAPNSTASTAAAKTYTEEASMKALRESLERRGIEGATVETADTPNTFRINYPLPADPPKVSIVMADRLGEFPGVSSLLEDTEYPNLEIVLVSENAPLRVSRHEKVRHIELADSFTPASALNAGAKAASGSILVFVDASVHALNADWLAQLVVQVQRAEIGVATGKLLGEDNMVRQAGLILYHEDIAAPSHGGYPKEHPGSFGRLGITSDVSAASCGCLAICKDTFDSLNGFDERYPGDLFDADLCIRVREHGQRILFTPRAQLRVGASLLTDVCTPDEKMASRNIWLGAHEIAPDPYYSPNWAYSGLTYGVEPGPAAWDVRQRLEQSGSPPSGRDESQSSLNDV